MTFNDNASLNTGQVESGGSGGGFGGGGMMGGPAVGGIGGLILMIIMYFLAPNIGSMGGGSTSGGNRAADNGMDQYGRDTSSVNGGSDSVSQRIASCKTGADANRDDTCLIVGTVNAVQGYWDAALPKFTNNRVSYTPSKTVIYSGQTQSGCGTASAQVGPFYCPNDRKVYMDAAFFQELSNNYGADTGQLAKMYVIAHEYGHAIQDQLGLLGRAQQDPKGEQSGAVRTELQADCLAGLWVNHATEARDEKGQTLLKPVNDQDIQSALSAASAVGDDRIQEKAQGRVTPESWTHGSSEARQKWFMTGYESGQLNSCDTFSPETVE